MARRIRNLQQTISEAKRLFEQGICGDALEMLEESTNLYSTHFEQEVGARILLSELYDRLGYPKKALEVIEDYEQSLKRSNLSAVDQIRVLVRLGRAWDKLRDQPKALSHLHNALKIGQQQGDKEGVAQASLAMGRTYRVMDECTIANDCLQDAVEEFRLTGNRRGLAQAYHELGLLACHEGEYDLALSVFDQAEKLIHESPDYYILGALYLDRAVVSILQMDSRRATASLEKAYDFFMHAKHRRMIGNVCANLGLALITLGKWARAESALLQALEISKEYDDRRVSAAVLDNLALILLRQGRFDESKECLKEGFDLLQGIGARWAEIQLWFTQTRVQLSAGELKIALSSADECIRISQLIGDSQFMARALLLRAEVSIAIGDMGEARRNLREVEERLVTSSNLQYVGLNSRLLGCVARESGRREEARQRLRQALSVFQGLQDRYEIAITLYQLGRLEEEDGDFDSARVNYQSATLILGGLNAAPDETMVRTRLDKLGSGTPSEKIATRVESPSVAVPLIRRMLQAALSLDLLVTEILNLAMGEPHVGGVMFCHKGEAGDALKVLGAKGTAERRQKELVALISAEKPGGRSDTIFHLCPQLEDGYTLAFDLSSELTQETEARLQPLLKIFEQGLELAHLKAKPRSATATRSTDAAPASKVPGFIHSSVAMSRVLEQIYKIRSSSVTVLITGESGTGKELVARAIHAESARSQQKFVPFNCTATTKELVDAHLFGYRRGAFTGAAADSSGMIRAAEHGTLFLDEIGDLALEVQPKLLRFLQEGEIQPLGEKMPVKVDVRVVAATNSDLEQKVAEGRFREDLFHRLNVIRLHIPPLRERREEIPLFIHHFLSLYSEGMHKEGVTLSQEAIELMGLYDWPGNVRQLGNEIRRIVAMADSSSVAGPESLSGIIRDSAAQNALRIRAAKPAAHANGIYVDPKQRLSQAVSQLEKEMLTSALRRHRGNISKTAAELGLTRKGLYIKKARLGIES